MSAAVIVGWYVVDNLEYAYDLLLSSLSLDLAKREREKIAKGDDITDSPVMHLFLISEAITMTTAITTAADAPIINDWLRGSTSIHQYHCLLATMKSSHMWFVGWNSSCIDLSVVCMLAIDNVTADVESWIDFIFAWEEVDIAGFKCIQCSCHWCRKLYLKSGSSWLTMGFLRMSYRMW